MAQGTRKNIPGTLSVPCATLCPVRGRTTRLTIGERVAWYRRRRGLSQDVLAGLVGRTTDWLSRIENNRIDLDRLSVIKALADALDVTVADLLAEPSLLAWTPDSGRRTVPALREALLDYRQITPAARRRPQRRGTAT